MTEYSTKTNMSEAVQDTTELQTLSTRFLTYHESAGNLHLRTTDRVLFIDKGKPELLALARKLYRNQPIRVTGRPDYSKTLSTYVFVVESLES